MIRHIRRHLTIVSAAGLAVLIQIPAAYASGSSMPW